MSPTIGIVERMRWMSALVASALVSKLAVAVIRADLGEAGYDVRSLDD